MVFLSDITVVISILEYSTLFEVTIPRIIYIIHNNSNISFVLVSLISDMLGIAQLQYQTDLWIQDLTKMLASVGPRIVPVLHYHWVRSNSLLLNAFILHLHIFRW